MFILSDRQTFPEASEPAERDPHHPAKLCRVPQAAELAVVATLHQGQCFEGRRSRPDGRQVATQMFFAHRQLMFHILLSLCVPCSLSHDKLSMPRIYNQSIFTDLL